MPTAPHDLLKLPPLLIGQPPRSDRLSQPTHLTLNSDHVPVEREADRHHHPGRQTARHQTRRTFVVSALDTATGKVIGKLSAQHRAIDFRDFLDQIDRQTDPALAVHVICDNLSTHKAPVVHRWLLAHPRFALHFTPTYSSWINQVERWLAELQRRCLERGVFCSLDELTTALEEWIKLWNENARPFKWTKTADQIIDRICRYCSRISGPGH